jgi:two-component system sensor histidine kinase KdpD
MDTEILRRTDELKTALLNAVSHDLRTPLASVITAGGSLLQRDVAWTPDERRELAETIVSEAQRLSRIIGNLLDLSRMEAGSLRPERGWFELGSLVDDVLSRLRELTAAHLVAVDVPGSLPPVFVDSVEMDQVLSNLVENAVKYTPPGTEIGVGARVVGEAVEVEVLDTGPGIPAHALSHLFEPFYRVEQKGPRPKGTGLGLAVAKGLVEAHGGRIWAENRTRGGARLAFTIPLIERPGAIDVPEAQRP